MQPSVVIEKTRNASIGFWALVPEHLGKNTWVIFRTDDEMWIGSPSVVALARRRWKRAKDGRYRLHARDLVGFQVLTLASSARTNRRFWSEAARRAAGKRMKAI